MTHPHRHKNFLFTLTTEHAKGLTLLSLALTALGFILSVLLYSNLRTDIEELLPNTARSVQDLTEVNSRLQSMENIVILIFSEDTEKSKNFAKDLGERLEHLPKDVVSRVEYKIDEELKFFKDRQALFIEIPDLIKIRDYVKSKITYELAQRRKNPPKMTPPTFDFKEMKKKYEKKLTDFDRFPDGYFATADEKIRAVVVFMPGKGLELAHQMKAAIEKTVKEMNPQSYSPDIQVKYTGNVQNLIEESAALVEDLMLSTVIVTVLVIFAMLFFFRSFLATSLLVASLFMGTFWTFGAAYLIVGYLNANTAFLASIVLGNGINFGIILLARYLEERRGGKHHLDAIEIALNTTKTATATAALGAGLSYGSLIITGFRGFSQFGIIGLLGMILCWLATYLLLPAFLTLADKRLKHKWVIKPAPKSFISSFLATTVRKFPEVILLATIVVTILSLSAFTKYNQEIIETDLSKLRDKRSMEHGSGALYKYIDDIFGHSVSPMVILTQTKDSAQKIADMLREEKSKHGEESLITTIQTLRDFVPSDQRDKARIITQIKGMLNPVVRKFIPKEDKALADIFTRRYSTRVFREKDLPPMLIVRFRESGGALGNIVLVDKMIEKEGDSAASLSYFVNTGRSIADKVELGAVVAGGHPITYDMYQSILNDGPKATVFAFLAVVILVIILFRNVKIIALALFTLLLGVTWLAGIILGYHLKVNFLNFIALPITFGIGIDYGVNILQRYREDGVGSIVKVIQNTGGAVMLCSLTTIIGYSSLLIAGNQAFVSFGLLAVLGELTCMFAAILSLPAYLLSVNRYRKTP